MDETTRWAVLGILAGGLVSLIFRRAALAVGALLVLAVGTAGIAAGTEAVRAIPDLAGLVALTALLPTVRGCWPELGKVSDPGSEFVPDVPMGQAADGGVPLGLVILATAAGVALLDRPHPAWWRWIGAVSAFVLAFGMAVVSMLRPAAVTLLAVSLVWSLVVLLRVLPSHRVVSAAASVLFVGWAFVGFRRDVRVALTGAWVALLAAATAVHPSRLHGADEAVLAGFPVLYLVVGVSLLKRLAGFEAQGQDR